MSRLHALVFIPALLLVLLALAVSPSTGADTPPLWQEVLPAKELAPLAEQVTLALKKHIDALAGGKLEDDDRERAVKKARGLTLLLAAGVRTTEGKGIDAELRAALHNATMKLDLALRKSKYMEAKAILAALPTGKGFSIPAFTPAPLVEPTLRDDALAALMVQYRTRSFGGLGVEPKPKDTMHDGLEAMLKLVGDDGKHGLKPEELARFAYRLAVLAEATRSLPPPKQVGPKDPAKWLHWSAEMRDASLELATATATKSNRAAISKAALKIGRSCNDCHKVFRDN